MKTSRFSVGARDRRTLIPAAVGQLQWVRHECLPRCLRPLRGAGGGCAPRIPGINAFAPGWSPLRGSRIRHCPRPCPCERRSGASARPKVGAKPLAKVFMPGTVEPRLRLFLGSDLGMPRRRGGRMCRPVRGSGSFAAHSPEADAVGLLDVSPRWGSDMLRGEPSHLALGL